MVNPPRRFVRRSEPELANAITEAQKNAAKIEPEISAVYQTLKSGERTRNREKTPRWQASYDLAMGQVLAATVRAHIYDALLGQIGQGKPFEDPRNNTWRLVPTSDITLQGQHSEFASEAKEYLARVIDEHPGTPWALLARYELQRPFGWEWHEEFTDLVFA